MSTNKLLIVDDEPNILEVIRLYLEHAGYEPLLRTNGHGLLEQLQLERPELVILDVMLPDVSGFELCRLIRQGPPSVADIPIILLTAKDEAIDKLRGFNLGIDDYIVKPFDPNELVARIKAVLRRMTPRVLPAAPEQAAATATSSRLLDLGSLWIDLDRYRVLVEGVRVELTPKEIELLYFLACSPGRVFTRDDLLVHVWNYDFAGGTRTVDAHVKNIRKKLGVHDDWSIQTLWGIGYSFEVKHA